jgi:hypothetical protein
MRKTKELCIHIAPMVASGLLILFAIGVLPMACLPRAALMAAAELGVLLIASAVFDQTLSARARSHSIVCHR